jgi:hypothetical protein
MDLKRVDFVKKIQFMKLRFLFSAIAMLLTSISIGQTTLLSENFGTTVGTFSAGWTSSNTTNGFVASNLTASTGYTGSSGSVNARFNNTGTNGVVHTLTYSNTLSTVGYTAITVLWGARATATFSQPVTFEWSSNGTAWNAVAYTQVASNVTWALVNGGTRISLPAGAENVPNLRFRFSVTSNNNGNYQIDDFTVQGTNAFVTVQNGDWYTGTTWVGGVVPTSAQNAIVNHNVTASGSITRNAATSTTISNLASLSVSNSYISNGATTVTGTFITSTTGGVTIGGGGSFLVNGTLQIDSGGFLLNPPTYGTSSTLKYNTGSLYGRGFEWTASGGAIGTPGLPYNVQLSTNATVLNYINGGTPGSLAMLGNLTVDSGTALYMDYGAVTSGGVLKVGGNVSVAGTISLGFANGDDLKIGGTLAFTGSGNLIGNNRAIFFTSNSTTQTITSALPLTIPYIVFEPASGSTTVQLLSDITISAPLGGNAISFNSASDVFDINSKTLTIGTAGAANAIFGSGTFKGSNASRLNLLGTGSIGTLNFTTGSQTLSVLSVDRTAGAVAFVLGTPLTLASQALLTNGLVDLGNNPLTIDALATITGGSANSYFIADVANGSSAGLRKVFNAAGSFVYPIGDRVASADGPQYSPATVTMPGAATFSAGAYAAVAVNDIKHPNYDAATEFITRYWDVSTSGITVATFTTSGTYLDVDVNNATEANYKGNKWNGTAWSNGGSTVNAAANITNTVPCIPGATNHVTAGIRDQDINVVQGTTQYITGSTYNFGSQPIGANIDVVFTVQNLGERSLSIVSSSITGNPPYSALVPLTNVPLAGPLGTRTFTIRFSPAAVGTFTGSITIVNNDPTGGESSYVINFTGTGFTPVPEINIKAASGGFGNIGNGDVTAQFSNNTLFPATAVGSSFPKDYSIQNIGTAVLNLTGAPLVSIGGTNPGDFVVTTVPATSSIAATGSTSFIITFSPGAAGVRSAVVSIANNDSDENPYTFYIEGTGNGAEIDVYGNGVMIPSGSTPASTLNDTQFGNVNITTGTSVQLFSVANSGNLNLTVSTITIMGADASDFSFTYSSALSATHTASTAGTLTITFNPSTIGVKNALVTITNTDNNEGSYTFAIQGTGIDYAECGVGALENIAIQDFETVPATPTMAYTVTQESGAGIAVPAGGQAYGQNTTTNTNKFIGARSFQVAGHLGASGTEKTTTVEFATVDASLYQQVSMNLRLGAYTTNTANGLDVAPEKVMIYISTNGGTTYSNELTVTGNSNSIWDINFSTGVINSNFDGNNLTVTTVPGSGSMNSGPRNITLNNLPNSAQLRIKVTFSLDRTDELWVIDDVKLQGKKPSTSTWNGAVWTPSAPTSTSIAVIAGNYNTSVGNVNACSCQINAGNTVTINANQYFDVQNEITNNGTITVENNGSLIQRNDAAVNSGTAFNIKRSTTPYNKYDYTYWSSPVVNAVIASTFPTWRLDYAFQFSTANYADVVAPLDGFDDNGNAWANVSGVMTPGKGYAIMAPTAGTFPATSSVIFTGAVNNGIVTIPVALSANNASNTDDFNLIGNPYPSAIYADEFISQNAIVNSRISGTLYFWTHRTAISGAAPGPNANNFITADYAMYNLSGAVGTGTGTGSGTGSSAPTGYIASCQGFFVDAASASNVVFNNGMRDESYANTNFFRVANHTVETDSERDRIWLNLESDGLFSQQLIGYFDNTTLDYDVAYDGTVNKTPTTVSFYSMIGSDHYRIQARPGFETSDVVPLGYSSTVANTYSISVDHIEGQLADESTSVFIEDKLLNIIHDLKQSSYTFSTEA